METVKDRLLRFLRAEGISKSEFARRMEVSVAYIGAMRKSMPEDKVARLTRIFPHLNRDWLLYGEGEMISSGKDDNSQESKNRPSDLSAYLVPLLPVEAFAGSLQMWSEGVRLEDCDRIVAPLKGADFAIRVAGDSMEPNIPNGSMIFIKKLNDSRIVPWGTPMVIDTENGVLVKVAQPSADGEEFLEAHSYNERYAPIRLPKASIYGLYRVLATVSFS